MNPLCIFLIDDHPLFRSGLRMVLEGGLEAPHIHEMASVEEALCAKVQPDLLLIDIFLSGVDGLSGISLLQGRWPDSSMVVVASDASNNMVSKALAAGAHAFLSKAEPPRQMLDTIKRLLHGRVSSLVSVASTATAESALSLSDRQLQVLELLSQGLSNRTIAQRLHLSENTIRWHVHAILAALEASSRSEAVFVARRKGLVE